jgi:hypothetical protein
MFHIIPELFQQRLEAGMVADQCIGLKENGT